jgi:hypothetical protein
MRNWCVSDWSWRGRSAGSREGRSFACATGSFTRCLRGWTGPLPALGRWRRHRRCRIVKLNLGGLVYDPTDAPSVGCCSTSWQWSPSSMLTSSGCAPREGMARDHRQRLTARHAAEAQAAPGSARGRAVQGRRQNQRRTRRPVRRRPHQPIPCPSSPPSTSCGPGLFHRRQRCGPMSSSRAPGSLAIAITCHCRPVCGLRGQRA